MSTHTPGPWRWTVRNRGLGVHDVFINSDSGWIVHDGIMDAATREEAEANARLIAAAPEMLEALKKNRKAWWSLESYGELMPPEEDALIATLTAIAAAEGDGS